MKSEKITCACRIALEPWSTILQPNPPVISFAKLQTLALFLRQLVARSLLQSLDSLPL